MSDPVQAGPLAQAAAEALGERGPFAHGQPGYRLREGQIGLASAIATAIESRGALVAEAGTGTGKTFAYLVPALLSGGRVIVSTGTRTLQDQLFDRDLPQVLQALGVRAECALLKGRANYVCRYHLRRHLAEGRFARREDIVDLRRIDRYASVSRTGDRAGAPDVSEDAPAWAMASSTRENCLGQECPDHDDCFVIKARQAAQRADVVVVNHHLFCADLALRDEGVADLLPMADALIFDEAHQLPEVATSFFGRSVSTRKLQEFARDVLRAGLAEARDAADWTETSRRLEQQVREWRLQAGEPGRLDAPAARRRDGLLEAVENCEREVAAVGAVLAAAAERGREIARCALRAGELVGLLRGWRVTVDPESARGADQTPTGLEAAMPDAGGPAGSDAAWDDDPPGQPAAGPLDDEAIQVAWAEVSGYGVTLHTTPLSVAGTFRRHRAQRPRAWVFVSATLAVGGRFEHFSRAIGMEDAATLAWDSPFDFAAHGLLYVPMGLGPPSGADFPARVFDAIWPLLQANRGRAFVLCTTLRMVEQLAQRIGQRIGPDAALSLLVQGTAPRAELLERFRSAPSPVLVGSASFWEGVDVRGRQLSLVVIDKLPFAPPDDPVLRARIDAVRARGEEPFRVLQMPAAAMALKQGAGRMIRSETDRGLLVVCDERLAEKAYGRQLLRSLPPFSRTRDRDQALRFLASLDEEVTDATSTTATSDDLPPRSPA